MSAQLIYDVAPLASIVRYRDFSTMLLDIGTTKWRADSGSGRLVRKLDARRIGKNSLPAAILLESGTLRTTAAVVPAIQRTLSVASPLQFEIVALPPIGWIRVVTGYARDAELLHLAADRADAEDWLATHPNRKAILDEVTLSRWLPMSSAWVGHD